MATDSGFSCTGLVCDEWLPLTWQAVSWPPPEARLRQMNEDNERILAVLAVLDQQGAAAPSATDEAALTPAEFAHFDFKLNLMIDLMGQLLVREVDLPQPVKCRLSPEGITWWAEPGEPGPDPGQALTVELYLSRIYPRPLTFYASAAEPPDHASAAVEFREMVPPVREALEKFLFRRHRRRIAQDRSG